MWDSRNGIPFQLKIRDEKMGDSLSDLISLVLRDLHVELGAKLVPFAGYEMPVQYPAGVFKEHLHTREAAGLFDVSHMGQVILRPKQDMETLGLAMEKIIPAAVIGLGEGRQRYGLFTNETGGILDDFMFANRGDYYSVVVNAACKQNDYAHLKKHLSDVAEIEILDNDRGLIALQGPKAVDALARIVPEAAEMKFMDNTVIKSRFGDIGIGRAGYTGEDGYEVSVENAHLDAFARALLAMDEVAPIGLGARDSLRLEAGLCLYGNDIDETTSPIEADLVWAIQKARRTGGEREGGFPGADRILKELAEGPTRIRVGLLPDGRAPVREGAPILNKNGEKVGIVTSGGFAPSADAPVAMGYVSPAYSAIGTELEAEVRGKNRPVVVAKTPFHTPQYKR